MATPITPGINLYAQQMELEAGMTELGINRFEEETRRSAERGREQETAYGSMLVRSSIDRVAAAVRDFVEKAGAGEPGRRHRAYEGLKDVDPEVAAYLGLKGLVASLTKPTLLVSVAASIGSLIGDEVRLREVRKQDKGLYQWLVREVGARYSDRVKHRMATRVLNDRDLTWDEWDATLRHHVGAKMIDLIIGATGIVKVEPIMSGRAVTGKLRAQMPHIVPTEETLAWIEKRVEVGGLMAPVYEPMIVPPEPWTKPTGGGYLSTFVRPLRFVKTRSRGYLEELEDMEIEPVYEAVNLAQSTGWRVNPMVLEVLTHLWDIGSTHGGVPSRYDLDLPPKPHDIAENEEARKAWRGEASKVHRLNHEGRSRRIGFVSCLSTATRYSRFDAIYFPYQLDFRGRLYAVPSFNPQGPDFMKALLHFAKPKELGEDGWTWLALHLANCGAFSKIDKAPLEERVQWVLDHEEEIIACAKDPYANLWWSEADSPFQFLAACFEWRDLADHVASGDSIATFSSQLPVALDGSCSGIQHFSIAFRDEVGGEAVNLRRRDRPADIYNLVAERVEAACQDVARSADDGAADLATQWRTFGIDRSLCKRPTMTFGYGSRQYGFREQIMTDTLDPARRAFERGEGSWPFDGDGFAASVFMSKLIADAVAATVVKAAEAMDWLKATAKVVAREGLPVRWTVPDGFPVLQAYRELESRRVKTAIAGSIVRTSVASETPEVDKRAQEQGIAPNFIHSLDGCHLRMTVRAAAQEGITDFALVHDSFGVHAGDSARFFQVVREAMVSMYSDHDVIASFVEDIRAQVSEGSLHLLPNPPAAGNLDLEEVLDSPYCFA